MKLHRVLTLPVLAGTIIGASVLGTPGIASADLETQTVTLTCRGGECAPQGGNGASVEGPTYSVQTRTNKWAQWGGEGESGRNQGRGAWDRWNWDNWNWDAHYPGYAETQCSVGDVAVFAAFVCDNDVENTIWIDVDQWGDGNQLNLVIQVQNITQIAASGSGNAANQADDNDVTATDVEQSNAATY